MPGIQRDGQGRDVGELEGELAVPAGIDETGGRVDEQAEATEAALALEARDEVVGDGDGLEGGAEDELAGVQDEGLVLADLDELGEVFEVLLHVDEPEGVVAEHPEVTVDAQVDRARLDGVVAERLDHDAACGELFSDGSIGEDHGRDCIGDGRNGSADATGQWSCGWSQVSGPRQSSQVPWWCAQPRNARRDAAVAVVGRPGPAPTG